LEECSGTTPCCGGERGWVASLQVLDGRWVRWRGKKSGEMELGRRSSESIFGRNDFQNRQKISFVDTQTDMDALRVHGQLVIR
jgi:hypothetical protein